MSGSVEEIFSYRCSRCTTSITSKTLLDFGTGPYPCPRCEGWLKLINDLNSMQEMQLEEEAREPMVKQEDPRLWRTWSGLSLDTFFKSVPISDGGVFTKWKLESEPILCVNCGMEYYAALYHPDRDKRFCPDCSGEYKANKLAELQDLRFLPPWSGEDPRLW